jgi:signal transduction histidine kinase
MQTDKTIFTYSILAATLFITLFCGITFLLTVNYMRRKRLLLEERDRREAALKEEVMNARMEMQEHMFKSISQEIHDNVGQILSLTKMNLNIVAFSLEHDDTFRTIKELVTKAMSELRDLGQSYHADRLVEQGLIHAIQHQLQQLEKSGLYTTTLTAEVDHVAIDRNKVIFIYRMVQEVLNNVIKHAAANRVDVVIRKEKDSYEISLRDNGKGFSRSGPDFKPGIGLSSIEHRASMIGAAANIYSEPGKGTLVSFVLK